MSANGAAADGAPMTRRPSGGMTFRAPEEVPAATWAEGPTRTTATSAGEETTPALDDLGDASPSASEWQIDESAADDESDRTSSRSGSGDDVRPLSKKAQQAAARTAVKVASGMAHTYLARTDEARRVGMFLADDDDAAAIGDPLVRILGRHAGSSGAVANPDVADGIAAMLGVAGFVAKQIDKQRQIAEHQAAVDAGPADV